MSGYGPGRALPELSIPRYLTGGVVAHNEEHNLRAAVRSLVDQELPDGVRWKDIWVVASGCTDGTVEVAQDLVKEDSRVQLVVEPDRGGKARALREVFRRATGDALVLLNSDARAEPGAVDQLLRVAAGKPAPLAVMGRPVVRDRTGQWASTFEWLWDLHHEYHAELLVYGKGGHLSDELVLVSPPSVPPIPEGIINDGSYLAIWLSQHSGGRWYAPEARVSIQVPSTVRDHLHQRRRIHVGNSQVNTVLGVWPTTLSRQFLDSPKEAFRLLRKMLSRKDGVRHFARVATWELASYELAIWDRIPPRKDHVRWQQIRPAFVRLPGAQEAPPEVSRGPTVPSAAERRVAALLEVAGGFGTGIPLGELGELLPSGAPETVDRLGEWLGARPDLARLEDARAFSPATKPTPSGERLRRAREYREYAQSLWTGPLSFAHALVRCAGITGSVAFGEPREGDDLDLFVVSRSGSLWWFLARTYFALYLARRRRSSWHGPTPCLNYVLEDGTAVREFSRRGDLLFAREALSVQLLQGEEYYRGLVACGSWMREELPRLYDARTRSPANIAVEPAPPVIRALNVIAFPLLATYLQLLGLARNHYHRRNGATETVFRTVTTIRRLAFASRRFERLRSQYAGAPADPKSHEGRSSAPGAPAAR